MGESSKYLQSYCFGLIFAKFFVDLQKVLQKKEKPPMSHDKFNDTLAFLLEEGRINHVISTLRGKIESASATHPDMQRLLADLDRTAETYSHMRRYLLEGNSDPQREAIYRDIKESLKETGRNYLFIYNENRLDPFFGEYRLAKVRHTSLVDLAAEYEKIEYHLSMARETEADPLPFLKKREELTDTIFRRIWSLPPWAAEERKEIERMLKMQPTEGDNEQLHILKAQIISALMLGLLKFNDPAKFLLLVNAYLSWLDDERLEARALTAIVLVLHRWGQSAVATPEIRMALESLLDSIMTYTRIHDVVMTLIRTYDTDRVSREVKDAFDTTMREMDPELLERLRRRGMSPDAAETGYNPEWEKFMGNKDIEEKMQNINDMQLEGLDVMMQTFARLKHFPFFRSVSNWFVPFSTHHSVAAPLFENFNEEGFCTMADATEMCSGDRFSFVLGILQMPETNRDMLASNVNASLEAMRDHVTDRENVRRRSLFATEVLSFARDIYRFTKLYPKHSDYPDPFEEAIDFLSLPVVGGLLQENEFIGKAADFYFDHGYPYFALPLYGQLAAEGVADRSMYEKMGFCHQRQGDYSKALENYERADLFSTDEDPSSSWLIKRLAFCNKALGRYGEAAAYYEKLLQRNPDDVGTEFHIGSMRLRSGDIKSARELISKVKYLAPDHKGNNRLYARLKGHDAFLKGNYREALKLYEEARGEQDPADFKIGIMTELQSLDPDSDINLLRILLDE